MRAIGILPILLFLITACTPATQTIQPWQLSDLRLLQLPGSDDPSSDLVAVYTRHGEKEFKIRLDLLELKPDSRINFYILLDTNSPGIHAEFPIAPSAISSFLSNQRWDLVLSFPHNGLPNASLNGNIRPLTLTIPHIQRDSLMDTVIISFDQNIIPIPHDLVFQVLITSPDGKILLDQRPPIDNRLSDPLHAAPLLIAFSDSFPAFTPAQTLRRWDGAHTGPNGERHGLKHILENSEKYKIPLVLLDLKTPTSISALDFINALPQVQSLLRKDLLLLPDVSFATPADLSLYASQKIAYAFDLPGSSFVYSIDGHLQPGFQLQFVDLTDRSHLLQQSGMTLIPLPDLAHENVPNQAGNEGLSLDVRRQLLSAALSSDPTDLVILGGSLPYSTWGDSDMSAVSMVYIAAHPWIWPLNADQLRSFPSRPAYNIYAPQLPARSSFPIFNSKGLSIGFDSIQLQERILNDLLTSSRNTITDLAWQMFFMLTSPFTNPLETQLHFQYLNQVESLLVASRWWGSPSVYSDCNQDIDLDLINECVLSNSRFFAIIETDGARISFLFERDRSHAHQLIGPLSQFFSGLSDPSLWHLEQGPAADPAEIPGAFIDPDDRFLPYEISEEKDGLLSLVRLDGQVEKVFHLQENGLSMDFNSSMPIQSTIPLVIEPQLRFQPGWRDLYRSQISVDSFKWGVKGIVNVKIRTSAMISAIDFTQSASLIYEPENPDLDYPPGHFLPFPFALIDISSSGTFSVDLLVQY